MDISIIIPTYNRKTQLKNCLSSIFSQDYPKQNFEVIVVDNNSNDGTDSFIKKLQIKYDNLIYLKQPHRGPAAVRNLGVSNAKCEIIGFTDDDCVLDKDWIKQMVEMHKKNPFVAAVGGHTWVDSKNLKAVVSQFLANGGIKTNINGKQEIIFLPTCNVSLKRKILEQEKFNTLFSYPGGEDLEYFWRLFKEGFSLKYEPKIYVFHDRPNAILKHLQQAFIYGRANFFVSKLHNDHPSLKDISVGNIVEYVYCVIKEFFKSPILALKLTCKIKNRLSNSKNNIFFWLFFYIFSFRLVYLVGNISQYVSSSI